MSVNANHTPGPWHVTKGLYGNEDELTVWGPRNKEGCCEFVATLGNPQEHADANRNLILSAPDLLSALRNLLDMVTDNRTHGPEVFQAADAIIKAYGTR